MRGRGMAVILIPDFGGELIQRFPRHVPVVAFQPVDPGHEFVTFLGRERQHTVFQFNHTHRDTRLPSPAANFKPDLPVRSRNLLPGWLADGFPRPLPWLSSPAPPELAYTKLQHSGQRFLCARNN